MKPVKKIQHEAREQSFWFQWLTLQYPHLRPACWAVPNGGYRNSREAIAMKRQGVTAGVLDITIAIPSGPYSMAFAEFKWGTNKLTKEQTKMFTLLQQIGYKCFIWYSFEQAKQEFRDYTTLIKPELMEIYHEERKRERR